jgi:hypothetical protein
MTPRMSKWFFYLVPFVWLCLYLADKFPKYNEVYAIVCVLGSVVVCIYCVYKDGKEGAKKEERLKELEQFWKEHHHDQ